MKKLLQKLYHGRIPGWDSQAHTTETDENREKIQAERRYLMGIMSPKAHASFKKLEALHAQSHARRYENTYTNAFRLGVMLMCAVFMNGDEEK